MGIKAKNPEPFGKFAQHDIRYKPHWPLPDLTQKTTENSFSPIFPSGTIETL